MISFAFGRAENRESETRDREGERKYERGNWRVNERESLVFNIGLGGASEKFHCRHSYKLTFLNTYDPLGFCLLLIGFYISVVCFFYHSTAAPATRCWFFVC